MGASFFIGLLVVVPAVLFFAYLLIRFRYKKAGPDEALIVYGRRKVFGKKVIGDKGQVEGFRIVRGGGTFVWPAWENYEKLSLRMMTLDIDLRHVYTARGIPINVKAVAQVKVSGDVQHIGRAAEGFLGVTAPASLGGAGLDLFASGLVLQAIARWNHAFALSWVAHENLCLNNILCCRC